MPQLFLVCIWLCADVFVLVCVFFFFFYSFLCICWFIVVAYSERADLLRVNVVGQVPLSCTVASTTWIAAMRGTPTPTIRWRASDPMWSTWSTVPTQLRRFRPQDQYPHQALRAHRRVHYRRRDQQVKYLILSWCSCRVKCLILSWRSCWIW